MTDSFGGTSMDEDDHDYNMDRENKMWWSLADLKAVSPGLDWTPWLTLLRSQCQSMPLIRARINQILSQMLSKDELDLCIKDAQLAASWTGDTRNSALFVGMIKKAVSTYDPEIWLVNDDAIVETSPPDPTCPEESRRYQFGRLHFLNSHNVFNEIVEYYQNTIKTNQNAIDKLLTLYQTQLATPHQQLDDTFALYSSFVSSYKLENYETLMVEGNKIYKRTKKLMSYYEQLEAELVQNPREVETWKKYLLSIKKYQPEAVEVLFWRTKDHFEPGDHSWFLLWVFYLDLMKDDYFGEAKEEYILHQFHRAFPKDPAAFGTYALSIGNSVSQETIDVLDSDEMHLSKSSQIKLDYVRRSIVDYMMDIRSQYDYERWRFAAMAILATEVSILHSEYTYYAMKFLSFALNRAESEDDPLVQFINQMNLKLMTRNEGTEHGFWSALDASISDDYFIELLQKHVDINKGPNEVEEDKITENQVSRKRRRLDSNTEPKVETTTTEKIFWIQVSHLPPSMNDTKLKDLLQVEFFDSDYLDNGSTAIFKVHGEDDFQKVSSFKGKEFNGQRLKVEPYERPTLWCSHFPDDFSRADLDNMFKEFGNVLTTVHPPLKKYCFYVFDDPQAAKNAIKGLNKKSLHSKDGKVFHLAVHRASKAFNLAKEPIRDRQVFVNRLNFKTSSDTIKKAFLQFGTIEKVIMPVGTDDNANKGFAKIIYATASEATSALALNGVEVDDRRLAVTLDDAPVVHVKDEPLKPDLHEAKSVVIFPFECTQEEAYALIWNLVGPIELFKAYPESKAYIFEFGSIQDANNAPQKLLQAGHNSLKTLSVQQFLNPKPPTAEHGPKRRLMVPTSVRRRTMTKK